MKTIIKYNYFIIWVLYNYFIIWVFGVSSIFLVQTSYKIKVQILIPEGFFPLGEQFFLASPLAAFLLGHPLQQHWTSYRKIP